MLIAFRWQARQARGAIDTLPDRGRQATLISFRRHETAVGGLIRRALDGDLRYDPATAAAVRRQPLRDGSRDRRPDRTRTERGVRPLHRVRARLRRSPGGRPRLAAPDAGGAAAAGRNHPARHRAAAGGRAQAREARRIRDRQEPAQAGRRRVPAPSARRTLDRDRRIGGHRERAARGGARNRRAARRAVDAR